MKGKTSVTLPIIKINFKNNNKGISTRKEEMKCFILAGGMMVYTDNPKESVFKFLELISEYSKVKDII